MLTTEDEDTSAEELVYHVDMPTSGVVALKEAPEESIQNFTQAHINKGEVIFIHEGEATGTRGQILITCKIISRPLVLIDEPDQPCCTTTPL